MDEQLKNGAGKAFALECGLRELWTDDGPSPLLRTKVEARALPAAQLVLMRFALDFYGGDGRELGFVEGVRLLVGCEGRDGMEALFFLGEFVGSALTNMPSSLEGWVRQYNEDFAAAETQ
jgi:hypothetical protein